MHLAIDDTGEANQDLHHFITTHVIGGHLHLIAQGVITPPRQQMLAGCAELQLCQKN